MDTLFSPGFFTQNRDRLRATAKTDAPIVVTGNGQMQRSGDEPEKFHQDNNFWYLTGISAPDLTLVIGRQETYLIVPGISFERQAFDGAHDHAAYAARSGIQTVLDDKAGWQKLREELRGGAVATPLSPPAYLGRHGLHTLPYRRRLIAKLRRLQPNITVQDVRTELALLRCVKQPPELQAIQKAVDITTATLQAVTGPTLLHAVTNEYELEAEISYRFRKAGADGHAFWPVVGAGKHTTTLHHMDNNGPVTPNDLIIVDIGASVEGYASDLARTVSQQPITGRAAEIYRAVEAVQDYAITLIKPGVLPIDYEKQVETFMGEQLLRLGVIREATRESIRHYFPHATSHFMGLDTHDTGDYRAPWQQNMVITCEPGIYIPEEGIGIRIEDDFLITEDGCRTMSTACPRRLTPVK